jgi:peptide/nickel transport system substrate-binding protein
MKGIEAINTVLRMETMSNVIIANFLALVLTCQTAVYAKGGEAAAKGGRLTYAEPILPDTYDPITTSDNETSLRLSELMFESLVYIDYRGEVKGRLAEKWNVFNGNQRITFYLRKDVKWHDGTSFTANDVKFTYDAIMNPLSDVRPETRQALEVIKSVSVLGDYVVKFDFQTSVAEPERRFLFKILPSHLFEDKTVLSKFSKFAKNPVGTGYYKFSSETKNHDLTLTAFPGHYGGAANIGEIKMGYQPEMSLLVQSLLLNAIDLVVEVPPGKIAEIANTGKFMIVPYNSLSFAFFGYNTNNPILAIKEVRQAFTMGMDRAKMLEDIYFGKGEVISGPFSPASWGYNPDVAPYPYDVAKANALLDKAGFKEKDKAGWRLSKGKPIKFELKIPIYSGNEGGLSVCLRFQSYMKALGVQVDLQHREYEKWKEEVKGKHDFDIVFAEWLFDNSSDISSLFQSTKSQPPSGDNFISYKNPKVDSLLDKFSKTIQHEVRRRINYELHEILAEECPYTFLWTLEKNAAIGNKIKKVVVHPYRFFTFINDWYIPEDERD